MTVLAERDDAARNLLAEADFCLDKLFLYKKCRDNFAIINETVLKAVATTAEIPPPGFEHTEDVADIVADIAACYVGTTVFAACQCSDFIAAQTSGAAELVSISVMLVTLFFVYIAAVRPPIWCTLGVALQCGLRDLVVLVIGSL